MNDKRDHQTELMRLKEDNRVLNEQVKRLVKAERHLAISRHDLDWQLRMLRKLSDFALAAGQAERREDILKLALDCLMSVFTFEEGVAFVANGAGEFVEAVTYAVPGMEPLPHREPVRIQSAELPRDPTSGICPKFCATEKLLTPFIEGMDSIFLAPEQSGKMGRKPCKASCVVLALPIRIRGGSQEEAMIMLRRVHPQAPLLEPMPRSSDIPYITLVGAHASIAIQNLLSLKEANDAIQSRDEFLSIASHELKTPVTSTMLLLQSLIKRSLSDSAYAQSQIPVLRMIENQARRLTRLVDQLLDVSRIRVGRFKPVREEFDLSKLLDEVISRSSEDLSRSGSSLLLDRPESLLMQGDPSQIEQVLTNLLTNAIKFGEGRPIEIKARIDGDRIRLTVKDQGIGITLKDQGRIFDRFERGVSSRHFGGLGLGLYISRQIIDAHGGALRVESTQGTGSIFTLELPRLGVEDASSAAEANGSTGSIIPKPI